jgi:hypothetical protein
LSAKHEQVAADAYLANLRRVLSCVTTTVLVPLTRLGDPNRQVAAAQNPFPLRGTPRLTLLVSHGFTVGRHHINDTWTIAPTSYRFQLNEEAGSEILAYHWHPDARSPITTPHLHVASTHPRFDLGKAHLPTGIVPLQAVIRCLITEFGVEPLRRDWERVLRDA